MYRKQTRPRLIDMPRRDPSRQLSPKPSNVFDRQIYLQQQHSQRPPPQTKPGVSSEHQSPMHASTIPKRLQRLAKKLKLAAKTPLRPAKPAPRTVSAIRPEVKTVDSAPPIQHQAPKPVPKIPPKAKKQGAKKNFSSQIPVISDRSEVVREKFFTSKFPGFRLRRLWKIKPGSYRLLKWDETTREVLLRDRNSIFRTRLPDGVMDPTEETNTLLQIGRPEDRQQHRVTVQWLPMI